MPVVFRRHFRLDVGWWNVDVDEEIVWRLSGWFEGIWFSAGFPLPRIFTIGKAKANENWRESSKQNKKEKMKKKK